MAGLIEFVENAGFTHDQAVVVDSLDDLFTAAIESGMIDGDDVEELGRIFGKMVAKHTGKSW